MKYFLSIFGCVLILGYGITQNASREFISLEEDDFGLKITVSDGQYLIRAYSDKIIETSFIPHGQQYIDSSHAVVAAWLKQPFQLGQTSTGQQGAWIGDFWIWINKKPFKISYHYKDQYLTSEKEGYSVDSSHQKLSFALDSAEVLFGGGARALGMNRRGNRLELYNKAHYGYEERSELMNYTMPLVLSSNRYAVHFDNPCTGYLDLDSKQNNTLTYESIGNRMTYQVLAGDDWKDLISEYTFLTGRQPMPPRWALGNFASRFGYHSEAEARDVLARFKEDSIPLDAIIFDLYWFGDTITGTMGNLEFHRDSFPEPEKMIRDFAEQDIKTILITEPFVLTSSKKWQECVSKDLLALDKRGNPFRYDFYFGNTGLLDIYRPHVRNWFWDRYKELREMGVRGIWGDLGEPEVHPEGLLHNGSPANWVHNVYGHDWARLIYEGYRKDYPEERPFILMRSGYSGSQRFGMIPWSGDVNRTWGGLRSQMEIALQMGMQGMAYMHSDLGGFAGANDDPELYVRWLQYGVFQPIFRPHAQEEVASEPIFKDSLTKDLARKAIELRYSLLPYNYTLAHENHVHGTPLMRPLFMEFEDEDFLRSNTYMWGKAFIVKAITDPSESNTLTFISLPVAEEWCDMETGSPVGSLEHQLDGSNIKVAGEEADIDRIPVYVRAGSFIPYTKPILSTENYDPRDVTVHFYYTKELRNSKGSWYEDDGLTPMAYEQGMYYKKHYSFTRKWRKKRIRIELDEGDKNTEPVPKDVIKVLNISAAPKKIKVNGEKIHFEYRREDRSLFVNMRAGDMSYPLEIIWR